MLNSLLGIAARTLYGKQLLALINQGNNALTGHRSEIIVSLIITVAILQHFGVLDTAQAKQIEALLGGMLPVTLAEKIGNILDEADKVLPPPNQAGGSAPQP